ncbi:glutamyl-tRNA(Gln) amidotransferase subunit A, chloroplastic/mitochondrial-like [Pistacia vera]|uniref:glutamyl-tRNA(Gln) amidotransferase subunit A, chloroplastic/mitochondrial-like n=1 Tax=Pistacia vera TaxID=55513 RepID=UPI0012633316|nr:glutamyl-tRNA(Gln) amidotransferase subunit A, chloroplastic/mitochondrial-like [Pistacia vera]
MDLDTTSSIVPIQNHIVLSRDASSMQIPELVIEPVLDTSLPVLSHSNLPTFTQGLSRSKPTVVPLDQNVKFTSMQYDKLFNITTDSPLPDPHLYQRLVGQLLYLFQTRPNISYSVNLLSQFMHSPTDSHMAAALTIVRYLKQALGLDIPSTVGSKVLKNYCPPFNATAVQRVKELSGIVLGKTNLDEFGMGSTAEASAFQSYLINVSVKWVRMFRISVFEYGKTALLELGDACVDSLGDSESLGCFLGSGGSSGGSAATVSARQCVVSLGSDTGGNVRQPASFCGVVGLKPTYGLVSRFGLMAYASSHDVIGCFGSSVADAGILLNAISGHDRLDVTSSKQGCVPNIFSFFFFILLRSVTDFTTQFVFDAHLESKPLKGLRVGLIRETLDNGVDTGVKSAILGAVSHLEELGCTSSEVLLPSFSFGLPAYYILASSESSSNLSRYDGVRHQNQAVADDLNSLFGDSRAKGFGSEVKMRILIGTYALSAGYYDAYYKRARQVRTIIQKSFKAALDENDIVISPEAPSAAYKIGEKKNDPLVNVNLAGLPALVLPCGFVDGGPVGLQMIGASFDEVHSNDIHDNSFFHFDKSSPLQIATSVV